MIFTDLFGHLAEERDVNSENVFTFDPEAGHAGHVGWGAEGAEGGEDLVVGHGGRSYPLAPTLKGGGIKEGGYNGWALSAGPTP